MNNQAKVVVQQKISLRRCLLISVFGLMLFLLAIVAILACVKSLSHKNYQDVVPLSLERPAGIAKSADKPRTPGVLAIISTSSPIPTENFTAIVSKLAPDNGLITTLSNSISSFHWRDFYQTGIILSLINSLLLGLIITHIFISFCRRVLQKLTSVILWVQSRLNQRQQNKTGWQQFRVVEYKGSQSVAGAKLIVSTAEGKVISKNWTSQDGQVNLSLPVGHYVISVKSRGLTITAASPSLPFGQSNIIYSGGTLHIQQANSPLVVTIPMKPASEGIGSFRAILLRGWQFLESYAHIIAWPLLVLGSGLNTVLLLWKPGWELLVIEIVYIFIVLIRIWLDILVLPSYGFVRDALSHLPLDLAVVRLYREGSNRLVITRATDSLGKFFAMPASGEYTLVITKDGYITFTEHHVRLKKSFGSNVQIRADLMPVVP